MTRLRCSKQLVADTLDALRVSGREGKEGIVLWLAARPIVSDAAIIETYVPQHEAEVDVFRIAPSGMSALMKHLQARKLVLAAQVHSHPGKAFHSYADDKWAIVRHQGALSIVVPNFATGLDPDTFTQKSATFCLSADDRWLEVHASDLPKHLELI